MIFMGIENMTAIDICKILKTASECGVKSLSLGDIKVEYAYSLVGMLPEKRTKVPTAILPQNHMEVGEQIQQQAIENENEQQDNQNLDELLLSDPLEYFKQVEMGVLDGHTKDKSVVSSG